VSYKSKEMLAIKTAVTSQKKSWQLKGKSAKQKVNSQTKIYQ
jgi:hypothetical protein